VVLEGTWDGAVFESDTMLVKHDEQYRSDDAEYDTERHACSET
jgi:cytochrome c-type biogenesis protein CcmE